MMKKMFHVYLVLGFAIFGGGMFLIPGLWKIAWLLGCVAVVVFLPQILSAVLDPVNERHIRDYCNEVGVTDVKVKPFPNHYGVEYWKGGRKCYSKCKVVGGKIHWKGSSPSDVEEPVIY